MTLYNIMKELSHGEKITYMLSNGIPSEIWFENKLPRMRSFIGGKWLENYEFDSEWLISEIMKIIKEDGLEISYFTL